MKTSIQILLVASSLLGAVIHLHAQGAAFTYQGKLDSGGAPYSGNAEFKATLWDIDSGGTALATNNPSQTLVSVSNGLFVLPLNFGANFPGGGRWLEMEVRTNFGSFSVLSPRQPLTPTPYAITAGNVSGTVASANLAGTYGGAVTFNNAGNSFTGNGGGLTNLNASQLGAGTVPDTQLAANLARTNQVWLLGGNASTTPGTQFLGTTDNQSLELRVNGTRALRLDPNATSPNVIGGYVSNSVSPGVFGATIAGGGRQGYVHTISAHHGAIGGGDRNTVSGEDGTIAGGGGNFVAGDYAAIGGGIFNTIQASAGATTIGGGSANTIQTNADYAMIGGGYFNTILPAAQYAAIIGGNGNTIQSNAFGTTIGGGHANLIQTEAQFAVISGGSDNTIQSNADYAAIGGGVQNTIPPNAAFATIPGGYLNSANSYAFAAGTRAKANHTGSFVWADSQDADFASTANNQFCIRASGGVQLSPGTSVSFGSTLSQKLNLYGTTFGIGIQNSVQYSRVGVGGGFGWYAGGVHNDNTFNSGGGTTLMTLTGGGLAVNGTFISASDRNGKENFAQVQPREMLEKVLALPLSSWNYKADPATRHVGPMAQDFYAAFNVGPDDKHIATVDADGVALAAIQGLNQKVEEKEARVAALENELAELRQLVVKLSGEGK